jgi:hypothetical protein
MNTYSDSFPPLPAGFYQAVKEARRHNMWIKAGRRPMPGQHRYVVTVANSSTPLFTHDDIQAIRTWLRHAGAA